MHRFEPFCAVRHAPCALRIARWRFGFVAGFVCLVVTAAGAQIRKADLVTLVGDTDDAIRLAKSIKDFFAGDPTGRRTVSHARDVVIQSWLEEKNPLQLTDQERAAVLNPDQYDKPVLRDIVVTFSASPPSIVLGWDVPPRLWPRLSGAATQIANRIVRDGAVSFRRALRMSVKLQDAEMYRVNADVDGNLTVVFVYE
jgi:hypothetical protein